MKKIKFIKYLFIFIFALSFLNSTTVRAASELEVAVAPGFLPGEPDSGSITLTDDYKLTFTYGYRVKDIKIWVCEEELCNVDEPTIFPNQTYLGNSSIEFDLNKYLVKDDNRSIEYKITANANFKRTETQQTDSSATLNYIVTIGANSSGGTRDDDVFDNWEKAIIFINAWIIPGIYITLAVIFVVKGILLAIDLIKYSDNREVRREKLRGFAYMFVGLLVVAIVNSTVGIITGLFNQSDIN